MEEATPKRTSIRDDAINLPNLLTMLRIALIPGVLFLLWEGTPKSNFWAAILYIGTALTDLIDGYLARKWGQINVAMTNSLSASGSRNFPSTLI